MRPILVSSFLLFLNIKELRKRIYYIIDIHDGKICHFDDCRTRINFFNKCIKLILRIITTVELMHPFHFR